jgi:hypothetical protein
MAADPKAMPDPTVDSRVAWILRRVTTSLTEARSCAKMKAAFFADDNAVYAAMSVHNRMLFPSGSLMQDVFERGVCHVLLCITALT